MNLCRTITLALFLTTLLGAQVPATTTPSVDPAQALPTYVLLGASFNQVGTPRVNLIAGAVYPIGLPALEYTSTVMNIIPRSSISPTTGKKIYLFSTTVQQSIHKVIYKTPGGKFLLLVGGGGGAVFSQASPSGTNVNVAASFTATPAIKLSSHVGFAFPLQGIYTPGGWAAIPTATIVIKP